MSTIFENLRLKALKIVLVFRGFLFVVNLYVYFLCMLVNVYVYFYFLFSVSFLRDFLALYNICNLIANFVL